MLEFANEMIRSRFHALDVDRQREWNAIAEDFLKRGKVIHVQWIEDYGDGGLEVAVRIDQKFHVPRG